MTIRVTQRDIDAGISGMCRHCPISLALLRETGISFGVFDDGEASSPFVQYDIELPANARRFMRRFDRDQGVRPFSFEFDFEPADASHPPQESQP